MILLKPYPASESLQNTFFADLSANIQYIFFNNRPVYIYIIRIHMRLHSYTNTYIHLHTYTFFHSFIL